jgi:RNA polymerase sigma-70 factor (ECF subfamily)
MSTRHPSAEPAALTLAAFTAVVDRQQNALHTFLLHLVGDVEQAYDLLQDTLHDAWRAARQGTAPFVAGHEEDERRRWLFRVAYHKGLGALRRRRLIHWESLDFLIGGASEPVLEAAPFEDQLAEGEALRAALARLSPQDRACFLLSAAHGLSAAEVGQIVGASPEVVRKRLSRAKQRLRAIYLAQNTPALEPER